MRNRMARWMAALLLGLAIGAGVLASGGAQAPVSYAADPTPTPINNSNPGGHGGGH
ncbi:MAG TPA: hypothetical protein PLO33_07470 [Kouleothrix sp.]|uniref:hypothetical protein n=1 Tax=Kouleothrix sp. TaxID=2779161 RepID=UPI002BFCEF1B|nr:hypothetical protein [Kouleothrix sp.]HRC75501.1 hypothetical protein [Kouleothrix sp.]